MNKHEGVAFTFFYFGLWVLIVGWFVDRAMRLTVSIYKSIRELFK